LRDNLEPVTVWEAEVEQREERGRLRGAKAQSFRGIGRFDMSNGAATESAGQQATDRRFVIDDEHVLAHDRRSPSGHSRLSAR